LYDEEIHVAKNTMNDQQCPAAVKLLWWLSGNFVPNSPTDRARESIKTIKIQTFVHFR